MNYYRIGYYYKNNCGIYEHLPIKGEVTTDKNVAEKLFEESGLNKEEFEEVA